MSIRSFVMLMISLALVTSFQLAYAEDTSTTSEVIRLTTGWQYRWGDGGVNETTGVPHWLQPTEMESSEWKNFTIPGTPLGREGSKWLWTRVRLPSVFPVRAPVLFIEGVDVTMEVFLDGQRLYRFGDFPNEGKKPRFLGWPYHLIDIPAEAAGGELFFRIWADHVNIGLIGTPRIGKDSYFYQEIIKNSMNLIVVSSIVAFLTILTSLSFLAQRKNLEYFYFAGFCVSLTFYLLSRSQIKEVLLSDASGMWVHLEFYSFFFSIPFFLATVDKMFPSTGWSPLPWLWKSLFIYIACASVLSTLNVVSILQILLPYQLVVLVYAIILVSYIAKRAIARDREARWLLMGFAAIVIACALEIVVSVGILFSSLQGKLIFVPWGSVALLLSMVYIFIVRLITLYRRNSRMKRQLERILAGTRELASMREKLTAVRRAIEFIFNDISVNKNSDVHLVLFDNSYQQCRKATLIRGGVPENDSTLQLSDCSQDSSLTQAVDRCEALVSTARELIVPIVWGERRLGVLIFSAYCTDELSPEEDHFLNTLASSLAMALSNIEFLADSLQKASLERELATAALVQEALLPRRHDLPKVRLVTSYQSAEQTGGDWYGHYYEPNLNQVDFYIGDVTGHGVPAALMTGVIYGSVYSNMQTLGRLHESFTLPEERLQCLAEITNRVLHDAGNGQMFATMFLASLNINTGEITFLNAGHNTPYLIRTDKTTQPLQLIGKRLGYDPHAKFKFKKAQLLPGDSLFLYTDGLIENTTPTGEVGLDEKRLRALLGEFADQPDLGFHRRVLDVARAAWQNHPPADDVTTFALCWDGPG